MTVDNDGYTHGNRINIQREQIVNYSDAPTRKRDKFKLFQTWINKGRVTISGHGAEGRDCSQPLKHAVTANVTRVDDHVTSAEQSGDRWMQLTVRVGYDTDS